MRAIPSPPLFSSLSPRVHNLSTFVEDYCLPTPADLDRGRPNGLPSHSQSHVFATVEQKAQERRRAIESSAASAAAAAVVLVAKSRAALASYSDDEDGENGAEDPIVENGGAETTKKVKPKEKKPKITVAEAASKIDEVDLSVFIADISGPF